MSLRHVLPGLGATTVDVGDTEQLDFMRKSAACQTLLEASVLCNGADFGNERKVLSFVFGL